MQNVWYKNICLEPLTWSFPTEATFLLRDEIQNKNFRLRITFQIQIFGTVDDLSDYLGVDFQAVGIAVVPRDDNIVPLVVIQGVVTVAFDHIGTIAEIKHIVYVPTRDQKKKKKKHTITSGTMKCFSSKHIYIKNKGLQISHADLAEHSS